MPGAASIIRAATPDTTAAACDVPVPLKSASPRRASGRKGSIVDSGARGEAMEAPRAGRAGGARGDARGEQVGLPLAAAGEGGDDVVGGIRGAAGVGRPDRDDERVV